MDRRSRLLEPAVGKENAPRLVAKPAKRVVAAPATQQRQQQAPAVVPKTPKARAGAVSGTAGRGGRGAGLSLRADGNGGAPPSSALRASTAAAIRSSKRHVEEPVDTSNSSSDFTGPQRVRVDINNPPDLSLSFWSLPPAATPDSKTSCGLSSKTVSRAARTAAGTAATPLHRHHHHQAPGATPRGPSTVARDTRSSSSRKNAAQQQSSSLLAAASTRKRARPEAAPAAAPAPTPTAAEARQQAPRGAGRGVGASGTSASAKESPAAVLVPSSTAAAAAAAADSSLTPRADYSHILNWKPAPRPNAALASSSSSAANTTTAASTAAVSARRVDRPSGEEEGGGGGPAPAGHPQRRQRMEQPAAASAAARTKQEQAPATATSARPFSASSAAAAADAVASGGRSLGARGGAVGEGTQAGSGSRPRTRETSAPSATVSSAVRPRISSSLEALRVRVVKKAEDADDDDGDDDDDDDDDSFEVGLKLKAYDAEVRRRSADAAAAPRLAAVAAVAACSTVSAEKSPLASVSKDAAGVSGGGGSGGGVSGGGAGSSAPPSARVKFTSTAAASGGAPAVTHELSNSSAIGGARVDNGFSERHGNGGGLSARNRAGTRGAGDGKDGVVGVAREQAGAGTGAGAMDPVPEEDGDMSVTIGTGSKVPSPAAADAIAGGGRGGSGGASSGHPGAMSSGTMDSAAATHDSSAPLVVAQGGGCSGSVSFSGDRLSSSGPVMAAAGGGGGARGEVTPPLGSEQTDTSISIGSGGGGDGVGNDAGVSSGLMGGGSTGGSARSVGTAGKADKAVAFAHAPRSNWSETMVNGVRYLKTAQIGRGGSSKVFRVVAPDCEMMALKVVKVDNRVENAKALLDNYSNEIDLLKRMQGNRFIINLENSEVDRSRGLISIVLELGETDLDQLLRQYKANIVSSRVDPAELGLFPGGLDANFVRVIWQQMLKAVQAMHDERVVHGDLKPANFVFVKGSLKLIDFGIAKAISSDTTNISRDSRLGTMNYMCPEAFEDTGKGDVDPDTGRQTPVIKQGRASDIWSLGCILYQMAHGQTPFSHLGMIPKIRAITNPNHAIAIADLEDTFLTRTLRSCLERDPLARAKIGGEDGLLRHPYLHPIAARASLENELEAKANAARALAARAQARAAELERELEARVDERVAAAERSAERRLSLRHEEAVAAAVAKAVAAEQARQAAGLSIAKSALKRIIATTVRVLNADESSEGSKAELELGREDIDRITGQVIIDMGRGGGGGAQAAGSRQ